MSENMTYPPPSGKPVILGKPKKRPSDAAIVAISCASIMSLMLLCCLGFYFLFIQQPMSTRDIPMTAYNQSSDDNTFFNSENTGEYYASIEEALKHSSYDEGSSVVRTSEEVFRFEDKDSATVYYFGENGDKKKLLAGYLFDMKNGKYSRLLLIRVSLLQPDYGSELSLNYVYQKDEVVAYYINNVILAPKEYARSNDDQPTYFGITKDANVKNLRILDKAPTEIIEAVHEDETYYIWCYIGTDFRQVLIDDPNSTFFVDYTYGQIIDALNIRFENE